MKILLILSLVLTSILAQATPPPPPPAPVGEAKYKAQLTAHVSTYDSKGKYLNMVAVHCENPSVEFKYPIYQNYDGYPQSDNVFCEAKIDDKKIKLSIGVVLNKYESEKELGIRAIFQSDKLNGDYSEYVMSEQKLFIQFDDESDMTIDFDLPHEMTSKASGKKYRFEGSVRVELVD